MSELPRVEVRENRHVESLLQLDTQTTDPELHYRWVQDNPLKIARHKMRGYTMVSKESGVQTLARFTDEAGDTTIRIGDTILMSCPISEYNARKKSQRKFAAQRLAAPAKQFREQAKNRKAKIINEEEE